MDIRYAVRVFAFKDNKVACIKYKNINKDYFDIPGGKIEDGETEIQTCIREFKEETGLTLVNPKLQGLSYWQDSVEGIIFVYTAEKYDGELVLRSEEGSLEWIKLEELLNIKQFDQNEKFTPYLFKDELFEGKFLLDEKCNVLKYKIRTI